MADATVDPPTPIAPTQRRSVPPPAASMPNAIVAAQPRSCERGIRGDVSGREIKREVKDLQSQIMGEADLIDRGAAGGTEFDHARGCRDVMARDAMPRDAVIAGKERHQRAPHSRGAACPARQPRCRFLDAAERSRHPARAGKLIMHTRRCGLSRQPAIAASDRGYRRREVRPPCRIRSLAASCAGAIAAMGAWHNASVLHWRAICTICGKPTAWKHHGRDRVALHPRLLDGHEHRLLFQIRPHARRSPDGSA